MEYKQLFDGTQIPAIGLGTWRMGGGMTKDTSEDKLHIKAIQEAIKLGITHIDTAEVYAAGHAEELVGIAIKDFKREKLFITTKVSPQHLFFQRQIITSCKNSLKRLKTDYIDLYLIHWPNPLAPMKNVMAAFDKLVSQGLVRYIGVSNFSVSQLVDAQKYSKNKQSLRSSSSKNSTAGLKIAVNQVEYSLLEKAPQKELLPYCQKENIILTAYTPLADGRLAGPGIAILDQMAKKYGKTCAQVALNWLISQENVIAIPKASSAEHVRENARSCGWKLSREDWQALNNL